MDTVTLTPQPIDATPSQTRQNLATQAQHDTARVNAYRQASKAPKTVADYKSHWAAFEAFCVSRGVLAKQLIVVEKSRALAAHLCHRFPKVRVVHGDAADMETLLKGAIVICRRRLPRSVVTATVGLRRLLSRNARLQQCRNPRQPGT